MQETLLALCAAHNLDIGRLLGMFDTLGDCDGLFTALRLGSRSLERDLERLGILRTNIRGGAYPGTRFAEAQAAARALLENHALLG